MENKMKKRLLYMLAGTACIICLCACGKQEEKQGDTFDAAYPNEMTSDMAATDFSALDNWVVNDFDNEEKANADADVIFFIGTELNSSDQENGVGNWTKDGKAVAFEHCINMVKAFDNNTRLYAPYYRQISTQKALEGIEKGHQFLPDAIKSTEVIVDLFAALDFYFENYNQGRPFILAGYSQGGASVQVVLENYFTSKDHAKYLENMVAAYSIAYGVDKNWLDKIDYIDFAKDATDTRVLISWVTEGPGGTGPSMLIADNAADALVINPINWKTDDTYASAAECLGTEVNGEIVTPGLYNLQRNAERGCLICDNNTNYLTYPGYDNLWGGTSLHLYEVSQVFGSVNQNVRDRIDAFLGK